MADVLSDADVGLASPLSDADMGIAPQSDEDMGVTTPQPSAFQKAIEPITSYPQTYLDMNREAQDQVARGVGQLVNPSGAVDVAKGLWNTGTGALGYVTSPISAGLRTVVGKPLEENFGIPKEYSEFAASLALPGMGLRSLSTAPTVVPAVAAPLSKSQEIAQAAQRLGVDIPRAAATDNIPLQSTSAAVKEIPVVGAPLVKASRKAVGDIENAVGDTASSLGSGDAFTAGTAAKAGLENWITGKSSQIADRLYGAVDQYVNPVVQTEPSATRQAAAEISARNAMSGLPPGKAVDLLSNPLSVQGGLTYEGIKNLRTRLGEMLNNGILPDGVSNGELKQLYSGLSTDLRSAAQNAGGDKGLQAFDRANNLFQQIAAKRSQLATIIGKDASAPAEQVVSRILNMSSGKGGGDISKLIQARKAMGSDNWNEVTSAIINRMGRSAEDAEFSGDKFITAYNNMSDAARNVLFNSTGKEGTSQAVKDLVTLSTAHRNLMRLGNPSGTGRVTSLTAIGGGLLAAPITTISSAVGGNVFARLMASPVTAKQTNQWSKAYVAASKSPNPLTRATLADTSAKLASTIADKFGLDPSKLSGQLQGLMPARPQDSDQNQHP